MCPVIPDNHFIFAFQTFHFNMINVQENISLKKFNTFGLDVKASTMLEFTEETDIPTIVSLHDLKSKPFLILGGGSNVLFTADYQGLIIHPMNKGIVMVKEDADFVWLRSGAGEVWDDLVAYTVTKQYGGLENLSNIPGSVGAAPIQNIGAYGVEVGEVIEKVRFFNMEKNAFEEYTSDQCEFGYRTSVFKTRLKQKIIISSVCFKLRKKPIVNLSYSSLKNVFSNSKDPSIKKIREAIIKIRKQKLPDPKNIGNAGSFFKNPVIPLETFKKISKSYACLTSYPVDDTHVKLPAAWLIEQSGWKGKQFGNAGVHDQQALVLVNRGNASGKEILTLANQIMDSVYNKFGIHLEMEVNVI
jgi:UDP-N-acetylmuramate dehydrogenase